MSIRTARLAAGLSQTDLAAALGVSRSTYRNLEVGDSAPPTLAQLEIVARTCGASIEDLTQETHTPLRLRTHGALKMRATILASVRERLAILEDVREALVGTPVESALRNARTRLGGLCGPSSGTTGPIARAAQVRATVGLRATEPIRDVFAVLEALGVWVLTDAVQATPFWGCCSADPPAVVVPSWTRFSAARATYAAAHELGHLLMHPVSDALHEDAREESEANAFAMAFLLPRESLLKSWRRLQGRPFAQKILEVSAFYGVSYRMILYALDDAQVVEAPHGQEMMHSQMLRLYRVQVDSYEGPCVRPESICAPLLSQELRASGDALPLMPWAYPAMVPRVLQAARERRLIGADAVALALGLPKEAVQDLENGWLQEPLCGSKASGSPYPPQSMEVARRERPVRPPGCLLGQPPPGYDHDRRADLQPPPQPRPAHRG